MDNRIGYGFRWYHGNTRPMPSPRIGTIATGQAFNVTGGQSNLQLGTGDLIVRQSNGHFALAAGAETTAVAATGVVVGVMPYWNGTEMTFGRTIPSGVAYGTSLERQTKVLYVPVESGYWEVDCDEAVTADELAEFQAFQGENVNHIHSLTNTLRASPRLDISTHATTATLLWRIVEVSGAVDNLDYDGANVKLIVVPNIANNPAYAALGI